MPIDEEQGPVEDQQPVSQPQDAGAGTALIDPMPDCYPCGPEDEKPGPADPDNGTGRNECEEGESCP